MNIRTLVTALLLLVAGTAAAHAQDTTLDRVQNLMNTGRFTEAGNTLAQWERSFASPQSNATSADRARALYLRGVLSTDPREAEDAYIGVVLSYPSAPAASAALLRLGQGLLTSGEPGRAVAYLERLRSDYPGARERETGFLWLARAQGASGNASAACSIAREGLGIATTASMRTLMELERDHACSGAPAPEPVVSGPVAQQDRARAAPPAQAAPVAQPAQQAATQQAATQQDVAQHGAFAVQTGAFRERSSAVSTAAQLRARGFDARVVTIEGNTLFRVRSGRFATSAQAAAAATRIRDAGFTAFVVTDVRSER
jgi:cell division septation protein DedD